MATDLRSALQSLTALPATEQPLLSVYLDWTPDGSGQRPAPRALEQELGRIADALDERGAARDSFEADRQRITTYVAREAPDDARGLAIFACDAAGLWMALPLQAPVETQVVADRYPHVFSLARVLDDYETYAIVLADSQESRMFVISLDRLEKAATTEADEPISRVQVGGWSQARYQRHTDHVVRAHTRDIAAELDRIVKRYDVRHVIVAGNDTIKGMVMDSLPDPLKQLLVDYIHLDVGDNLEAILEAVEPMMREVERAQETAAVAELEEQSYLGGLGVVGIAEAAQALTNGQVRALLMLRGFVARGGECPNCGALRAGQRTKCPYDGAELQPVDLREAFTARAVQQSAEVQIVEASAFLDQHEGVGALLRYRAAEQARTA